jgi:hypothetical protein
MPTMPKYCTTSTIVQQLCHGVAGGNDVAVGDQLSALMRQHEFTFHVVHMQNQRSCDDTTQFDDDQRCCD